MRKSIIALTLVCVLALSAVVSAADIKFNGALETKIEWHRDLEGNIETNPYSKLGLNFGLDTGEDKTRAVVEFGIEDKNDGGLNLELDPSNLKLKKAYIETDGSFWHGGPEATTRFGSLDIDYGPFATDKNQHGISINSIDVGPVRVNGFYGVPTEEHKSIQGFRTDMSLKDVAAGASLIHDFDALHLAADGAVRPLEDLVVGGTFVTQVDLAETEAAETEEEDTESAGMNHLIVVGAEYIVNNNMSVHGGYKSISEDWKPAYIAEQDKKKDRGQNWVHETERNNSGFYAGVATEQQGITLAADYDQMFKEAVLSAATNYEGFDLNVETILGVDGEPSFATKSAKLGVERDFNVIEGLDVAAKYAGEWTPDSGLIHSLGAKTKLGLVPAINGLELNSEVTIADLETIGYVIGADFQAPNGIKLGVEHVGGKYADDAVKTGTTAKAGIAVKF
ncbi:MAG: hypothetical protein GX994_01320 [Firmicutes bacterium]|nr:hypothetical protein [Bacillota bacterium]